jgi:hypothetical protein
VPWGISDIVIREFAIYCVLQSLHPLNLDVYITWNAGTVYRISALNPESNKFVTLWQGSTESPSVSGQRQAQIFSPKLCPITFASNTYRVDIAPAGPGTYVEIGP